MNIRGWILFVEEEYEYEYSNRIVKYLTFIKYQ